MSDGVNDRACDALEPSMPYSQDQLFVLWMDGLKALSSCDILVREATATPQDGRSMKDLQVVSPPITVLSIRQNVLAVAKSLVLIAETKGVNVGYCVSLIGARDADPIFIQAVAVAPQAKRRGAGLALLTAAAERAPHRDVALAVQEDNVAAQALIRKFADSVGASVRKVTFKTYRKSDLGIGRTPGYRAWLIQRTRPSRD